MRKILLPFITVLMLALFVGSCSNEDVMPEIDKGATSRTISFTASMPGEDDPATRVSAAEEADRGITLTWDENDKLDLLFVQGTNKFNVSTTVTNITDGGKKASFTIVIPEDITDGTPYNLYGVYGGGAVSTTNPALIGLPAIEEEALNEENVGKKVMLRFAKENLNLNDAVGAVNFEHVGFLFTAKIKVTTGSINDITSVQLVGADTANETWAYNASENHFNMETGDFTAVGTGSNTVSFQNSEKAANNNILTVRNWLPATETAWPAIKLSINGTTETATTKPGRTPVASKAYYLYATWDGADLAFADKEFTVPAEKGTKENPYSVAEAFAKQGASKAWVRGYIVGYKISSTNVDFDLSQGNNNITTNIAIADSKDELVESNVIGVQLPSGVVRAALNLNDNPTLLKAEVLLYGSLENYFGTDAGLKNVSDYEILATTPLFQADNTPITFTSSLELTRTISITTNDTQAWTATSSDESWLTVAPANGTGSGDVTITATENTDTEAGRTATVTLTAIDNAELAPIVIDVTQEKLVSLIDVDPTAIAFTTASGSKTLTVNSNVTWTASATIIDGAPDWLTITPTTGNSGETTISATATENTTFAARNATINITDGAGISIDVAVTQEAVVPFLNVDPTVLALGKEAVTDAPVAITANVTWTAAVNTEATWLTISPASGANDGTILVSAEANNGADARNATITITPDAASGLSAIEYSVTQAGATTVFATDLFFSEYIEGSSDNKYLEIYNGTGVSVNLSDYKIVQYNNGKSTATATYTLELSGTLEHDKVYVIANSKATIYSGTSDLTTTSSVMGFNGDDALALVKTTNGNDEYIDIFGEIGDDPGSAWTATGGYSTANKTLVRKSHIKKGVIVNPTPKGKGFTTLDTEWDVYDQDTTTYLGSHSTSY